MKLFMAPMEGVVDWVLRDILTNIGGIDQCVTEFIRVTDKLLPDSVFYRYCPELKTNGKTRNQVPVFVQLLGGQAEILAVSAKRAVELGAPGIDLNFGCPAKTVNRHDGGATLLKCSQRLFEIVTQVRKAVPASIPVYAKIRLGFDDPNSCIENSKAIADGGADALTVHCRTKVDMYKPPAYWDWIPKIKQVTGIPIIANGEIWNAEDLIKCQQITGCDQFMIGRGAIADPFIFLKIRKHLQSSDWKDIKPILPHFFDASCAFKNDYFAQARTKQWLRQISLKYPEAVPLFDNLKVITKPSEFKSKLYQLVH